MSETLIPHVDPSRLEKLNEGYDKDRIAKLINPTQPVKPIPPIPPVKPIPPPSQLIREGQMPRDKPAQSSQFIKVSGDEKYQIAVNFANELLSGSEQLTRRYIENEEFIVSLLNLPWYKNFFIKNKILNYMRHINDTYKF